MSARSLDALLVAGWLLGFVIQLSVALATGYTDVFPPQLLLGIALCFGAGFRARKINPGVRGRRGALAGAKMMGTIVVAYFALAFAVLGPDADSGGETWFSLLVEAPFWVGLPLGSSSFAGYLGWRFAGRTRS
jgi:hypothetical protein